MALSGLRLFGVELLGGEDAVPPVASLSLITFRELGALVRRAPYRSVGTGDGDTTEHRRMIDAAFQRGTILPAPFGTVFRSGDQVSRWLEMNHIALAEG
ncbi:MAG: GvpL/GvpF family gas vesicle protein, partial [Gemmatimonadaceae bacterium]